ncbi:MAG: hypothetical protein EU550_01670 [Promethearchaeota archaeon]|nr:MAG: hypothetical protein EU550_01670 [Candidatus Lokiarchaeota archaeon]
MYMFKKENDLVKDPILQMRVNFKKKFTNLEIDLGNLFFEMSEVLPSNIINLSNYYLFFVPNELYFEAKNHLKKLKRMIKNKKVVLVRDTPSLQNLLMSFFPDVYIHDLNVENSENEDKITIIIVVLTSEELAIAIGENGSYIKLVNKVLQKYIKSIEVKCELKSI